MQSFYTINYISCQKSIKISTIHSMNKIFVPKSERNSCHSVANSKSFAFFTEVKCNKYTFEIAFLS